MAKNQHNIVKQLSFSLKKKKKKNFMLGLPWHPVVKNSPANAGYTGLIHGLGTMILHTSEQLSLCSRAHALQRESHLNEKPAHRS